VNLVAYKSQRLPQYTKKNPSEKMLAILKLCQDGVTQRGSESVGFKTFYPFGGYAAVQWEYLRIFLHVTQLTCL
jgi:hypothetical protein